MLDPLIGRAKNYAACVESFFSAMEIPAKRSNVYLKLLTEFLYQLKKVATPYT